MSPMICVICLVREFTGSQLEVIWELPNGTHEEYFIDYQMSKYPGWEIGSISYQ